MGEDLSDAGRFPGSGHRGWWSASATRDPVAVSARASASVVVVTKRGLKTSCTRTVAWLEKAIS